MLIVLFFISQLLSPQSLPVNCTHLSLPTLKLNYLHGTVTQMVEQLQLNELV